MNYEYKIQRILEANTAKYYMNKLGYSFKDLEPHIGRKTMKFHYDVHYRNFTKGLNEALGNRPKPNITALLKSIKNYDAKVNHNAGGYYNHSMYWKFMKPGGSKISTQTELGRAIKSTFGSFNNFKKEFKEKGTSIYGSGWVWLVKNKDKLEVITTPNQDNPLMHNQGQPVFGNDMWEHAFYLDDGPYKDEFMDRYFHVVDWDFCNSLFIAN
jgi:Fe-Mn family superoxide dismutase|tara:strand:- start:477 stop:1112 length:636 start_codon:yes stop_codon:yes gene_type:complete